MVTKLPTERKAVTHKFNIGDHKFYLTIGFFDDGRVGEVFMRTNGDSTIKGLLDCLSISVSMGLQRGIPIEDYVDKFRFQSFEPSGFTKQKDIRTAKSMVDYAFRWIELKYCPKMEEKEEQ